MRTIVCMISFCLTLMSSQGEDLEGWLRSIPQIKDVTTYNVKNANCTLINVRVAHPHPLQKNQTKENKELVKNIQNDVLGIGTNLQSRLSISSYYFEGYISGSSNTVNEYIKYGRAGLKEYKKRWEHGKDRRYEINWTGPPNLFLAVAGNMEPRVTEDTEAYMQGIQELERDQAKPAEKTLESEPFRRLVMDNRELGTLKTLAADRINGAITNQYALLMFGGAHDFTDSIKSWNATNRFKFSLITVTPKSYYEYH